MIIQQKEMGHVFENIFKEVHSLRLKTVENKCEESMDERKVILDVGNECKKK